METFWFVLLVLTFLGLPLLIGRFCALGTRTYWQGLHRETQDIPERPDVDARKAS